MESSFACRSCTIWVLKIWPRMIFWLDIWQVVSLETPSSAKWNRSTWSEWKLQRERDNLVTRGSLKVKYDSEKWARAEKLVTHRLCLGCISMYCTRFVNYWKTIPIAQVPARRYQERTLTSAGKQGSPKTAIAGEGECCKDHSLACQRRIS